MKRWLSSLAKLGFAAAVGASFIFGGMQVLEARVDECGFDPPTVLGECAGEMDPTCQQRCEGVDGWLGVCYLDRPNTWCCICAI